MIQCIVGLKQYVNAREGDGLLDAMTAEYLMLALDTLALGVLGQDRMRFEPMVKELITLVYADQFESAYSYCVDITPALGK